MVFNTTFNNISVILWQSVLFGGGNWSTREKTIDLSQVTDKLYYIMSRIRTHNFSDDGH
jgi:hypothetical protein